MVVMLVLTGIGAAYCFESYYDFDCDGDIDGSDLSVLADTYTNGENICGFTILFGRLLENYPFKPGVAITFDDRSIDDWYAIKNLLSDPFYHAKATFFVTRFDTLDEDDILHLVA